MLPYPATMKPLQPTCRSCLLQCLIRLPPPTPEIACQHATRATQNESRGLAPPTRRNPRSAQPTYFVIIIPSVTPASASASGLILPKCVLSFGSACEQYSLMAAFSVWPIL